jgi:hypothetical protein
MSDPWLAGVDRNVSAAPRAAAVRAPALLNRALQAGSTRVFTVARRVLGCAAAGGHPQTVSASSTVIQRRCNLNENKLHAAF